MSRKIFLHGSHEWVIRQNNNVLKSHRKHEMPYFISHIFMFLGCKTTTRLTNKNIIKYTYNNSRIEFLNTGYSSITPNYFTQRN